MRLSIDIETDGLLPDCSEVWCLSTHDVDTDDHHLFTDISEAFDYMNTSKLLVAHNGVGFDLPVLHKLYGWEPNCPVYDTLITSQVLHPNLRDDKISKGLPLVDKWSHSLKAWGKRIGEYKGDQPTDWTTPTQEMFDYCQQDTAVTAKLFRYLEKRRKELGVPELTEPWSPLYIEHQFKYWIMKQEAAGFPFNEKEAEKLIVPLMTEMEKIDEELQRVFPPYTEIVHYTTPKRQEKKTKEVTHIFNPGSRKQVGERLRAKGWEPDQFTSTGLPTVNEETMLEAAETIPEAKLIATRYELDKRLGMIANGNNAWLKLSRGNRIHGQVQTLGAVTTRVSHRSPNMSQVPAVGSYLGEECRALFHAEPGWVMVGADLSGIELRGLAHYMHAWDGGEYAREVLEGDVHTRHQEAFGLPPGKEYRSIGKGGSYCLIYGGGDIKLAKTLGVRGSEWKLQRAGAKFRSSIESKIPALGKLQYAVKYRKNQDTPPLGKNYIRSLAGHPLYCRGDHSALNTLLQSFGAVVAKVWYILFHQEMEDLGYSYGRGEDYYTLIFAHDEIQVTCRPELSDVIGELLRQSATTAGDVLGVRIRIDAEYKTGNNWSETH